MINDPITTLQMRVEALESRETAHKKTIDELQRDYDAAKRQLRAAQDHIHLFDQVVRNIGSYVGATCAGIDVPHANGKGSDTEQAIILKIAQLKAELAEARKVVDAAKNLANVKGRHNSELAMKLLIDAMQEKDE